MRYTRTKLEKIIYIGFARIDQIIDKACDDLGKIIPKKSEIPLPEGGIIRGRPFDIARQALGLEQLAGVNNAALYAQMQNNQHFAVGQLGMSQGLVGGLLG